MGLFIRKMIFSTGVTKAATTFLLACSFTLSAHSEIPPVSDTSEALSDQKEASLATKEAIFAGGCFWCMEPPFDKTSGVLSTTSGYTGGSAETASYKLISRGDTDHLEVLRVEYDPKKVTYQELLDVFWANIDPFNSKGQFCDLGRQYTAAIFVEGKEEKSMAVESMRVVGKKLAPKFQTQSIVTQILPKQAFYPAEDYHQDYYQKNPLRYKYYRYSCGRDQRLKEVWDNEEH